MKKENYIVPEVEVVTVSTEALVCASPLTIIAIGSPMEKNIETLNYETIDGWDD